MRSPVILYARQGCHLCEQARDMLDELCAEAGATWLERDIDVDETLKARYGDFVPVVEIDGQHVGFWRIKPDLVRAALAARGGQ